MFRRLWPGLGRLPQTERDPGAGAGRGEEDRSREVRLRLSPTSLRLTVQVDVPGVQGVLPGDCLPGRVRVYLGPAWRQSVRGHHLSSPPGEAGTRSGGDSNLCAGNRRLRNSRVIIVTSSDMI